MQTLSRGHSAELVQRGMERLRAQRILERLWDHDADLWSDDPATQQAIRQRLGWLSISEVMARQVPILRRLADEVRQDGLRQAFLLGMGGSGLFAEVCRNTIGVAANHLDLTVLDTTDPTAIRLHEQAVALETLLIIVSSKSGSTSEISALSKYFYGRLSSLGKQAGMHCVAITDAGASLEAQAAAWPARRVLTHGPGTGAEVGGRFSALTYFGLFPAALMGLDIARLLGRAEEMLARCRPGAGSGPEENPAAQLGVVLGALGSAGYDKLTLLCAPALASFGTWVEQLIAESLGKAGRGIAPICGESSLELSRYGADRIIVELQVSSERDQALARHVEALADARHPVIRIHWQDRYDLGGEVAKWFVATAIAGHLLELNPFDEPNVKESKDRTKALLEQYLREGRLAEPTPALFADEEAAVYGSPADSRASSLSQCLREFFQRMRPREYAVVLSFLPRTATLDEAARVLRNALGKRLGCATMLGFGPRYLHSTGQLYKGGPDNALFLQFTAEEERDLPIPGERFTFGVLKQAQALGDFQAMQQRGRRILRVHLRRDPERVIQRVAGSLDEAIARLARP